MFKEMNIARNSQFDLKVKQLFPKEVLNEMFAALDSDPEFRHAGVVFQAEKNELSKLSVNPAKLLFNSK